MDEFLDITVWAIPGIPTDLQMKNKMETFKTIISCMIGINAFLLYLISLENQNIIRKG